MHVKCKSSEGVSSRLCLLESEDGVDVSMLKSIRGYSETWLAQFPTNILQVESRKQKQPSRGHGVEPLTTWGIFDTMLGCSFVGVHFALHKRPFQPKNVGTRPLQCRFSVDTYIYTHMLENYFLYPFRGLESHFLTSQRVSFCTTSCGAIFAPSKLWSQLAFWGFNFCSIRHLSLVHFYFQTCLRASYLQFFFYEKRVFQKAL